MSEQGIIGQLGNASFSVVDNSDSGHFVQSALACRLIKVAAMVLLNQSTPGVSCDQAGRTPAVARRRLVA